MKTFLTFFVLVHCLISCSQNKQQVLGDTAFQKQLNAQFKDVTKSPLKEEDINDFQGLDFFEVDSAFVVKAHIKRLPNSEFFKMKTTTDRLSSERVYGVLSFEIKGESYQLNIYQGEDLMTVSGYEDYLFLPFLDLTCGSESYGGGRYIDCKIPEGDTLIIDFNKAYNPYCAYNDKYSCPIVPRENFLNTRILAGVKAYKKH